MANQHVKRAKVTVTVELENGRHQRVKQFEAIGSTSEDAVNLAIGLLSATEGDARQWIERIDL